MQTNMRTIKFYSAMGDMKCITIANSYERGREMPNRTNFFF